MGHKLSRIALTAGLAAVLSMPAAAATSEWKIDPQHSSAQFSVRYMAISTVRGAFSKVNGTIVLDDKDVTNPLSTSPLTSPPWIPASPPATTIFAATNSLTSLTSPP